MIVINLLGLLFLLVSESAYASFDSDKFISVNYISDNSYFAANADTISPVYNLVCNISDRETGAALKAVKVKIVNNITGEVEFFETTEKGEFSKLLKGYKQYSKLNLTLTFEKDGFVTKTFGYDKILDKSGDYLIKETLKSEKKQIVAKNNSELNNVKSDSNKTNLPTKDKKESIIVVGSYKQMSYANMTIKDLKKSGYKVYNKTLPNGHIRVGAYVYCADKAELEAHKAKLKKKYPVDLWILPEESK